MKKELKLEPTLERNGRVMPRCQALSQRKGTQCTQAARRGHRVCHMHGAGTKTRVEAGERKPVGRPPIHGLYSKREKESLSELIEEVYVTEGALENSDRDLAALKATMWLLKERLDTYLPRLELFDRTVEGLEHVLDNAVVVKSDAATGANEITISDARDLAKGLGAAQRILSTFDSLLKALADIEMKTIMAHKVRAETAGKLAETKALAEFCRLLQLVRSVVSDSSPSDEWLDNFEARLKRELYGPLNLEVPDLNTKPEDLN